MCVFIEAHYNAMASNLKKEGKEKRSSNLFSFVEGARAPQNNEKRER